MCKRIFRILAVLSCLVFTFSMAGCKKEEDVYKNAGKLDEKDIIKLTEKPQLDFTELHNYVIDQLTSQATPFFFVVEGKFDISGDNDKKNIKITCTCLDGTTEDDVDLFLSMVLNYIAINTAEQDFRFEGPKVDNEGTYLDFGTVFKTYSLDIDAKDESGDTIKKVHVNAGDTIPVDPRYIKE